MSENLSRVDALAGELEALRSEIAELDALDTPTDEQSERFATALGEWDVKKAQHDQAIERAEKVEAVRAAAIKPSNREAAFGAPNVIVRQDPFEGSENVRMAVDANGRTRMGSDDIIGRALSAFEGKQRGVKDSHIEALVERIETIPGAAEYALVHGSPAYRSGFQEFMRSQGVNPMYGADEQAAIRASMALGNSTGGYALPTLLDPTLIHTGTATKNPIRRLARVEQGTQNVWHGVSVGNVTVYRKGEGSAFTDGTPTFAGPSVTASLLSAYVTGSYEIFEDSALQAQLPGLINEAFDYKEGTEFISGSGSTAPLGIVTAISATAGCTVTATTRGAFTAASGVDVFALLNSVASRYEESVTWVANKATFNTIKQMPAGSGATSSIWPNYEAGLGAPLLGSPVASASDMASATTSGTVLIVLGDFSQYVIYDRIGTSVEFVQNVVDGDGLPTGSRGLLAHKRNGANVTDLGAFRFLKT